MVFDTGIFLNMFDKNLDPLISLTETNLLFIFYKYYIWLKYMVYYFLLIYQQGQYH